MKRKTFHNYEIIDILNALFSSDSLVNSKDPDKKLSVRILWKINGNINTLKAIQMRISEEEQKINEEYFNDEKSQKNENGLQEVKPEFRTEFLNKKQELMKHFKTMTWVLMAMAMFVCESASAQYYSRPSSSSSKTTHYNYNDETQLNIVEVQVALDHFGNDVKSVGMQSLTYSYIHGFGLSSKAPMFLEVGAGMEYAWCDNKLGAMHNLAFVIPVSFSYEIPTAGTIAFVPYTGPFLRLNQTGDWDDDLINGSIYKGSEITDDYGKFNRFQVGWQLGCRVHFTRSFHAGLAFKFDLSEWCGRMNGKRWNVGLGIGLDF